MPLFRLRRVIIAIACLALPGSALAADLFPPPLAPAPAGLCVHVERSHLLDLPPPELRREVEQRFANAVEAAERPEVVNSARPTHTWAFETRYSCAKAIGYLKTNTVDDYQISKCACFYDRMLSFMP